MGRDSPTVADAVNDAPLSWARIGKMAEAIGEACFSDVLMEALAESIGASDCMLFLERQGDLKSLFEASALCRKDLGFLASAYVAHYPSRDRRISFRKLPVFDKSIRCNVMAIDEVQTSAFRNAFYREGGFVDHVWSLARYGDAFIALSCLRRAPAGPFDERNLDLFVELSPMFMSFVSRHARAHAEEARADVPFHDLSLQRARRMMLAAHSGLAPREIDVCARILRGMTSEAIALDLNTSIHTVRTHRKRAYAKMHITSMAELFSRVMGPDRTRSMSPGYASSTH